VLNSSGRSKHTNLQWYAPERERSSFPLLFFRLPLLYLCTLIFAAALYSKCLTAVLQYGCPEVAPTPDNPNPPQQVPDGQNARFRRECLVHASIWVSCTNFASLVPANCSTAFWDPQGGSCLCTSSTCAFVDSSRPIGVR